MSRALDVVDDLVALAIDVGRNVVRDLAGRVAQADVLVERRRADARAAAMLVELLRAPEAHVMAAPRIAADRLLERQVFLPPEEVEVAHGRAAYARSKTTSTAIRIELSSVSGSAGCHPPRAWRGGSPSRSRRAPRFSGSPGMPLAVCVMRGASLQPGMMTFVAVPHPREDDVRDQCPAEQESQAHPRDRPSKASGAGRRRDVGRGAQRLPSIRTSEACPSPLRASPSPAP